MLTGGSDRVVKLYQPWSAPVRAACLTDPAVLPEIAGWVAGLRDEGRVPPDTRFTIERRDTALIGVLRTAAGRRELAPGSFLVFTPSGLDVLSPSAFFRHYRAP